MRIGAGGLAIAFALVHGAPALAGFASPSAPRGSHEPSAVPRWARAVWLALAAALFAGAIFYLVSGSVASAVVVSVCVVGIWLLAIANGYWIHGRPTLSHHLVRGALVAVLLVLIVAGVE